MPDGYADEVRDALLTKAREAWQDDPALDAQALGDGSGEDSVSCYLRAYYQRVATEDLAVGHRAAAVQQQDELVVVVAVQRHGVAGRELRVLRVEPTLSAGQELAARTEPFRLFHQLDRCGRRAALVGPVDLVEHEVARSFCRRCGGHRVLLVGRLVASPPRSTAR